MIDVYYNKIQKNFKQRLEKSLNSNLLLSYNELESSTLELLDLQDYIETPILKLQDWYLKIVSLSYLSPYIQDIFNDEILLHSHSSLSVDKNGHLKDDGEFAGKIDREDYQLSLELLAFNNKISWNYKKPFQSFDFTKNDHVFRATLLHHSISKFQESKLFLRRIRPHKFEIEDFVADKALSNIIKNKIFSKSNMIISGSTSSGKTSFINALISIIDSEEHLVVLEDTKELFSQVHKITSLLSQEHIHDKNLVNYCSYALRLRPDRIIIGEIRSKEIVPFILSMNSGNKGLLSSLHANSAIDSISRMGILFSLFCESKQLSYPMILKLICKNVDSVIHLHDRKIIQVIDLIGCNNENPIFEIIYEQ